MQIKIYLKSLVKKNKKEKEISNRCIKDFISKQQIQDIENIINKTYIDESFIDEIDEYELPYFWEKVKYKTEIYLENKNLNNIINVKILSNGCFNCISLQLKQ